MLIAHPLMFTTQQQYFAQVRALWCNNKLSKAFHWEVSVSSSIAGSSSTICDTIKPTDTPHAFNRWWCNRSQSSLSLSTASPEVRA